MDIPDAVEFSCQQCERTAKPAVIQREQGRCRKCRCERWRVKVTYHVVDGPNQNPSELGTTAALNALGIGLAMATGTGFVTSGGRGQSRRMETAAYSDVPGDEIVSVYAGQGDNRELLAALVGRLQQQEADAHRARMANRGAQPCGHCGAVFVPMPNKLWTMASACSKVCCAKMMGAERYADIEEKLAAEVGAPADTSKAKRLTASLEVPCVCGEKYQVPRTYVGTRRPCPHCGERNEVTGP